MQGISQSKHQHLVDALLHLEILLGGDVDATGADLQQAADYRLELENMHDEYKLKIAELSMLIDEYHLLFKKVKMQFISPELKKLKKETIREKPGFNMLLESLRVIYAT